MKASQIIFHEEKKLDSDRVGVIHLFVDIYRRQCGLEPGAPAEVAIVDGDINGGEHIYELRVRKDNRWETRRMSVSAIGEESGTRSGNGKTKGSKSKCYKVTYDNLLVVKIPPSPITDFDQYVESIDAEGRIARRLSPSIEFVAPCVTAVLRKFHPLPDAGELSPAETERRYVELLRSRPLLQDMLKIDGGFVFVMDLSRHAFLSQVIEGMHDPAVYSRKMSEEILKSHNLLWDILEFENKYGSENLSVSFQINKIYAEYDARLARLLKHHGMSTAVPSYQRQDWFLRHLSGRERVKGDAEAPAEFVGELNAMLADLMAANAGDVAAYRQAVLKYVYGVSFTQNKIQMSGLIYNMINLLALLRRRKIAIRDLKPDNLFVVADTNKYPLFLSSPEESSLGLIDFETAVDAAESDPDKLPQPLLAGTPAYATPSHLFPNRLLVHILPDLPHLFNMQDWHATVGMIYYAITGELLFDNTRKLLFKTKSTIRRTTQLNLPLTEGFKEVSRLFWGGAVAEFREKLDRNERMLKSVPVVISPDAREMFREDVGQQLVFIRRDIQKYVDTQVIFQTDRNRKNLIQSPSREVSRHREKWEKGQGIPRTPPGMRTQIIRLLKDLERLKRQHERLTHLLRLLDKKTPRLSAYDLSKLMFNIIFRNMYNEDWGELTGVDPAEFGNTTIGPNEPTIMYEETLLFEASI